MNNDRYSISYGSPLSVKDRPHRETNTTRPDYGLPSLEENESGDISFFEASPPEDGVEISQPDIREVEVTVL